MGLNGVEMTNVSPERKTRILILGGTGMLGHVLLRYFFGDSKYEVYATTRNIEETRRYFPGTLIERFIQGNIVADDPDAIGRALTSARPDVVINCIGIIKQLPLANDPVPSITINALLPHRIALACRDMNARMVHISTDCVFNGKKGMYEEADNPSPEDLYGRTKLLGEVDYPHCITLRTSIIGHELKGGYGLIEWFLAASGKVKGYRNAIYSGFPTIELARIVRNFVLPDKGLIGVYHVSSEPLSKFDLLGLVARSYCKHIEIEAHENPALDRSLISARFRKRTGYVPPSWPEMIDAMRRDYELNREQYGR